MTTHELYKIVAILKQNHPAFVNKHKYTERLAYLRLSEEQFDKKVDVLLTKIDGYNENQVNRAMCSLFASLGDAHTMFLYPRQKPLSVGFITCQDEIYLSKVDKSFANKLLLPVTSVDGCDIKKLLQKAKKLISAESKEWKNYFTLKSLSDPAFLAMLGIEIKDCVKVGICNKEYTLPAYSENIAMPTPLGHRFFYDVSKDDVPIIRYSICRAGLPNWDKFYSDLKALSSKYVIVDLRGNDGGDSAIFSEFILPILKEKQCRGVALVDNGTFSSGILAALQLEQFGFTLVGEKIGQPLLNYGQPVLLDIGNRYFFRVCTQLNNLYEWYNIPNSIRLPKVRVSHTIEALRNNTDLMVQQAKIICQNLKETV